MGGRSASAAGLDAAIKSLDFQRRVRDLDAPKTCCPREREDRMSQHVSLAEFEANLRRYYYEDDLSRTQVKDLYRQWQKFRDTPYGLLAFERSFLRENNPANGLAWAEERWAAHPDPGWHPERTDPTPITVFDQINMFLSAEVGVSPRPRPLPYCPAWLVGEWQYVGWVEEPHDYVLTEEDLDNWYYTNDGSEERAAFEAQGVDRRWILCSDGRVDADDDLHPDGIAGCTWRYHHALPDEIWFERKRVLTERAVWLVTERTDDEMILHRSGWIAGDTRWRRVGGPTRRDRFSAESSRHDAPHTSHFLGPSNGLSHRTPSPW